MFGPGWPRKQWTPNIFQKLLKTRFWGSGSYEDMKPRLLSRYWRAVTDSLIYRKIRGPNGNIFIMNIHHYGKPLWRGNWIMIGLQICAIKQHNLLIDYVTIFIHQQPILIYFQPSKVMSLLMVVYIIETCWYGHYTYYLLLGNNIRFALVTSYT